ncbi:MAG: adenylosuccinate synthase [Candidatus Thermoplasmatota archaeon]|nr:adenylosuccinate synthase [Candidatus Thermoplasmatota archaeon]
MACTILMGTQWGDEGKGKVTDILAREADAVVRYQGGNNAGHTIVVGDRTFKLHLVPSGVVRENTLSVIGDGTVIDPWVLRTEIRHLNDLGISTGGIVISDRAHLIMPYHRMLDGLQEAGKKEGRKVGTTGRGIGPCYQDKAARVGIRMGDLRYPELLREKVCNGVQNAKKLAKAFGVDLEIDEEQTFRDLTEVGNTLIPHMRDAPLLLNDMIEKGKNILLEGAQGTFLDIDRGTYPFVTSSSCTAGYASAGSGIGPLDIDRIVGVVKAYTTRVGEGPFPTELKDDLGKHIQDRGHEFGTTTNRPRRCGWLDLVMVRSSVQWNSITDLALTKVDVLSGSGTLMVCTGYRIPRKEAEEHGLATVMRYFPSHLELLAKAEPVYVKVKGWGDMTDEDWRMVKGKDDLPGELLEYMGLIEREVNADVKLLSFGKGREQTISIDGDLP